MRRCWDFAGAEVLASNPSTLELQIAGKYRFKGDYFERESAQFPPTLRALCAHQLFPFPTWSSFHPTLATIDRGATQSAKFEPLAIPGELTVARRAATPPKWREIEYGAKYEWRSLHRPADVLAQPSIFYLAGSCFPATANTALEQESTLQNPAYASARWDSNRTKGAL